ncbi:MAG TPA: pyrroloquinoline quinone biosynthesis protein PqqE [Ferrovibrio sp.]
MANPVPPLAILLELTHRCPLQCLYCSNPLQLRGASAELTTQDWFRVLDQAADLGILQVHFSGGEPAARRDLTILVAHARERGLYSNLITSGIAITRDRLAELAKAGLDHVQLSFQDTDPESAERINNYPGSQNRKLEFARWVRDLSLPLTVNAVVHRQNIARVEAMIELALELGAARVEVAHVQYYGWALLNRDALMPSLDQLREATRKVEAARQRLRGRIVIDYVIPDYYARQPKACMGGWGRQFLNVTPDGKVLPCHAAETIPDMEFDSVKDAPLAEIWRNSDAFRRFRGVDWMPEPCRSCDQREVDWGGCRCQALAVTGSAAATDPACALSPWNGTLRQMAFDASAVPVPTLRYRRIKQPASASA